MLETVSIGPAALDEEAVVRDVELLRAAFGPHLRWVGLFGSCIGRGFERAQDVDIALRVDGISFDEAAGVLRATALSYPIPSGRLAGRYSGGGGVHTRASYDVVLLTNAADALAFLSHDGQLVRFL